MILRTLGIGTGRDGKTSHSPRTAARRVSKHRRLALATACAAALHIGPAFGQSLHYDVEILLGNAASGGKMLQTRFFGDDALLIGGHPSIDYASGYGIWPANFADLPGGPYSTDDPGFQAFPRTLLAGDRIFYRPLGSALYWSTSVPSWNPAPAGTSLRVEGTVPAEIAIAALVFGDPAAMDQYAYYSTPTSITGQGIIGPSTKMVDEASTTGALHTHLNWFIEGDRPAGAYLAQLQLVDPAGKYADSSPFYVLFNNGLTASDFQAAYLSRLLEPTPIPLPEPVIPSVPEPAAAWMMLTALGALHLVARRRKRSGDR